MDTREVYITWDSEEVYLGRVDEICGESLSAEGYSSKLFPPYLALPIFFQDVIASLAFATNEVFPDTIKIIIR